MSPAENRAAATTAPGAADTAVHRCAVYWLPTETHPLWAAGCRWLGRPVMHGDGVGQPPPLAQSPWRYGFHATLKAPWRLPAGVSLTAVVERVRSLAAGIAAFDLPPLQVDTLQQFVALRLAQPLTPAHPLQRLADNCVRLLDDLRAPPSETELQRRLQTPLDDVERALLARWGYPHVFDRWRFHMTLSDSLPDASQRQALCEQARAHFEGALRTPDAPTLRVEDLAIVIEPGPGQPFRLLTRVPLKQPPATLP